MMHRFGSAALALALTAGLSTAAFAEERPMTPALAARPYANTIILNGDKLDTSAIPFMEDAALVPMRLIAEGDFGSADWWAEDGMGIFFLGDSLLQVTFSTGEIVLEDETVASTGVLNSGVTFIPVDVLSQVEGYEVKTSEGTIEITTPNNDPLIKAGHSVMKASKADMGIVSDREEMKEFYSIPTDEFESIFGMFSMMTSPDAVIMGKLKEGADVEAVKAAVEAYRAQQEETFTWYLSDNLPKTQNAKVVEENGWFLFLIAAEAEAGVETFKAFAAAN